MRREKRTPRPGWQQRVESLGFDFHTADTGPYWDESACYVFSLLQIDELERASSELHARCLEAAQHVIDKRRYTELGIPIDAARLIEQSWEAEPPSLYGRFDLSWTGVGPPKLLEYNADTPTGLLEAAVVQWDWLEQEEPQGDQYNSLHERLIAGWRELKPYLRGGLVHFAALEAPEDLGTVTYLQDTAEQAGLQTRFLPVSAIGWSTGLGTFVDQQDTPIESCFKLYPWEWMLADRFGGRTESAPTLWIEPAWKLLLSSKGILAILWELFPGHPNLLEAHLEPGKLKAFAKKPLLAREGANVRLVLDGEPFAEGPDQKYGTEGFVEQALAPPSTFDGRWPVLGCWMVQGEPAGLGVREGDGPITTNTSRFVPHRIAGAVR